MNCSCQIPGTGENNCSVGDESYPRARKRHRCCECYRVIEPGERYNVFSGYFDGWARFKTCIDCATIRDVFFTTWEYEQLWDGISETLDGQLPLSDCMMKLTKRGRDMICDMIEKGWEELR